MLMSDLKTRDPLDVHVGQRLRMRRGLAGLSQEKLAEAVGVSFQQIQKYENGSNRVGARRLFDLGQVLSVPVEWFFEGFSGEVPTGAMVAEQTQNLSEDTFTRKETIDLLKAYYQLPESVRKHVLAMVKSMKTDSAVDDKKITAIK